ncbi:hypothetical protein ACS3SW_04810 [Roseobacteraceae bacterium S113]
MSWIVFTGDIVDSTALSPRELEHAFTGLSNATRAMGHLVDDIIWVRRGGDGWQMALTAGQTPISPLRAALVIAAHFVAHGSATRIAAAEGDATLPANRDLNTAHGPVFQASGRLLDEIPSGQWLDHAAGGAQRAAFHLADHIAQGWTQTQARTMAHMLVPGAGPRADLARELGKSRQAVDQALNGAGIRAISAALNALEHPQGTS